MKITSATLRQIAAMPEQAMVVALTFLAEQLEKAERRQAWDRERKSTQKKAETERKESGIPQENASRVYINNLPSEKVDIVRTEQSLSLSQPKNSRAHGTNPRAIGTNPRALAAEHPAFARFWSEYPPREGNKDRKAAVKAFNAALRRCDPDTIIDGAFRYRVFLEQKGERQFVRQARTWLNADGWTETYDISTSPGRQNSITSGFDRLWAQLGEGEGGPDGSGEVVEHIPRLLKSA